MYLYTLPDQKINKYKKNNLLFVGKCLRVNDWIIIAVIIMFLTCCTVCLATVLLTLIDKVCRFLFLNQPCERHIMAIFQDDNVKIPQTQIVKEWLGESMKNHFHAWINTSESWP